VIQYAAWHMKYQSKIIFKTDHKRPDRPHRFAHLNLAPDCRGLDLSLMRITAG